MIPTSPPPVSGPPLRGLAESAAASGVFEMWFEDLDGNELWRRQFRNMVFLAGMNLALDSYLGGAGGVAPGGTGPYVYLVTSTGFSGFSATDTALSHPGWTESTAYANRGFVSWSLSSMGSKTGTTVISITSNDILQGGGVVFGNGALSTAGDTGGTLYSGGTFVGGPATVIGPGNLNVSYTAAL